MQRDSVGEAVETQLGEGGSFQKGGRPWPRSQQKDQMESMNLKCREHQSVAELSLATLIPPWSLSLLLPGHTNPCSLL